MNESLHDIAARMEGVKWIQGGRAFVAICPYHGDTKRSMHVGPSRGFHCYGCLVSGNLSQLSEQLYNPCTMYEVAKKEYKKMVNTYETWQEAEAIYVYTDCNGVPLYRVQKTPSKQYFYQKCTSSGLWQNGIKGVTRVLYRCADLCHENASERVFFVEGEKDAETLWKHRLVATTLPMGAGKRFPMSIYEPLRGRTVIIIPDNDYPGEQHADMVFDDLLIMECDVSILKVDGMGNIAVGAGGDITDWFEMGGTKELLLQGVE